MHAVRLSVYYSHIHAVHDTQSHALRGWILHSIAFIKIASKVQLFPKSDSNVCDYLAILIKTSFYSNYDHRFHMSIEALYLLKTL